MTFADPTRSSALLASPAAPVRALRTPTLLPVAEPAPPVTPAQVSWHHVVSDFWTADDETAYRGSVELLGNRFRVRDSEGSIVGVFPTLTEAQAHLEQRVLADDAPEASPKRAPREVLLTVFASATGLVALSTAVSAVLLLAAES